MRFLFRLAFIGFFLAGSVRAATLDFSGSTLTLTLSTGEQVQVQNFAANKVAFNFTSGSVTSLTGTASALGYTVANPSIGTLTAAVTQLSIAGIGDVSFQGLANGAIVNALALNVNVTGAATVSGAVSVASAAMTATAPISLGANITTSSAGGATLNGAVSLTGSVTLDSSAGNGPISFSSTTDGANALILKAGTGVIAINGAIGGGTALGQLSVTANTIALHGGGITTVGDQLYNGAVVVGANTNCNTATGGVVNFNGSINATITAHWQLTVGNLNPAGKVIFGGAVGSSVLLQFLTVNATQILINCSLVIVTGNEIYNGDVFLGGASPVEIGSVAAGLTTFNNDLTLGPDYASATSTLNLDSRLSFSANSTLHGTLDTLSSSPYGNIFGGGSPTFNNPNLSLTFLGTPAVGNSYDIVSSNGSANFANVIADGATKFYVSGVDFTATNTGGGGGSDIVLTAVNPTNTLTVGSGQTYSTIKAAINASVSGDVIQVFGSATFAGFTTNNGTNDVSLLFQTVNGGTVQINSAVTLTADTAFSLNGTGLTFTGGAARIDGDFNLTIQAAAAQTVNFQGNIGSSTPLNSLTIGSTITNQLAANFTTNASSGGQTYYGNVQLQNSLPGNNATLTGKTVTFLANVGDGVAGGGKDALAITGNAVFAGTTSSGNPVGAVTVSGQSFISTTNNKVTTGAAGGASGAQTYSGAVILGNATTLASGGAVSLNQVSGGGNSLTVNGPATGTTVIQLNGVVSTVSTLAVNANNGQAIVLNTPSISTTGSQTYTDAVQLQQSANLTGSTMTLNGADDQTTGHSLTVSGNAVITADIGYPSGELSNLTVTGTTLVNPASLSIVNIETAVNQTYEGGFTLGSNVAQLYNTADTGTVDFGSTLSGTGSLEALGTAVIIDGPVNISGGLIVAGNASINANITTGAVQIYQYPVTLDAGPITLDSSANNFPIHIQDTLDGAQALTLIAGSGAVTLSGTIGGVTPLTGLTITSGGTLAFPAVTLASPGNLSATGNGAVTQTGTFMIPGATTLAAGAANDITLTDAANALTGAIAITTGNNVNINNNIATVLGASTVSGTLQVTSNGALTQSGALAVTGTTTLAAGAANDISLTTAGNSLTGAIAITTGNNVNIANNIATALAASTVSGTLQVTSNGAITQTGALAVTGTTTLAAGTANNITVTDAANAFTGAIAVTSGKNVNINNNIATVLAASTISGTFQATSNGALTQSGALAVTGVYTITAKNAININGAVTGAAGSVIQGSAGNDTFTIGNAGSVSGMIVGGGGMDTLVGPNVVNTWNITGANAGNIAGRVNAFTGIANLTGGSNNDTFNFAAGGSVTGKVDGGAGNDALNNTAIPGAVVNSTGPGTIHGFMGAATGVGSFDNIDLAPIINAVSPVNGPPVGGTPVTLTGANFTGATAVKFGGTAATSVVVVSATSITCTSPAGAAGTVDITVTAPGGTSALSAADKFNYVMISVAPATLPAAQVGIAYNQTISGSGGTAPYTFSVSAGALPAGLSLSAAGVLSGTPTASGNFNFTVKATDSSAPTGPFSGTLAYTLTVNAAAVQTLAITTQPADISIFSGQTATLSVEASGSALAYQWFQGLSGDTSAPVTGATAASFTTPALTASANYWVQVSNSAGKANSNTAAVAVLPQPVVNGGSTGGIIVNATLPFSVAIPVSSSTMASWNFGDGSTASGANVTHQFTVPGTYQMTVTLTDGSGQTSSQTFSVTVLPTPFRLKKATFTLNSGADSATISGLIHVPQGLTLSRTPFTINIGGNTQTFNISRGHRAANGANSFTLNARAKAGVTVSGEAAFTLKLTGNLGTAFKANEPLDSAGFPTQISVLIQFNAIYDGVTLQTTFKPGHKGATATGKL